MSNREINFLDVFATMVMLQLFYLLVLGGSLVMGLLFIWSTIAAVATMVVLARLMR